MKIVCDEMDIFSRQYSKHFAQLQKMFIRSAEGQHKLYLSDPGKVCSSNFFEQAVAPMNHEEWKELIQRTAYAPDKEDWSVDPDSATETIHARLSTKEQEADELCRWHILPGEAGKWAEMPLKILMENQRDWSAIQCAIHAYKKTAIEKALNHDWIEHQGCGGIGEIKPALEKIMKKFSKARCAIFMDSDKKKFNDSDKEKQTDVKNNCDNKRIPCHILYKREIENYIPEKIFEKIGLAANAAQTKKIAEWKKWTDEEKDFTKLRKYFGKTFSKTALKEARESYKRADKRFSINIGTITEVLEAQAKLLEAQTNHTLDWCQYAIALSNFFFTIGQPQYTLINDSL